MSPAKPGRNKNPLPEARGFYDSQRCRCYFLFAAVFFFATFFTTFFFAAFFTGMFLTPFLKKILNHC